MQLTWLHDSSRKMLGHMLKLLWMERIYSWMESYYECKATINSENNMFLDWIMVLMCTLGFGILRLINKNLIYTTVICVTKKNATNIWGPSLVLFVIGTSISQTPILVQWHRKPSDLFVTHKLVYLYSYLVLCSKYNLQ